MIIVPTLSDYSKKTSGMSFNTLAFMASIISDTNSSTDQKCNCNHLNQVKHGNVHHLNASNTNSKKAGMTFNTLVFLASIIIDTKSSIDQNHLSVII